MGDFSNRREKDSNRLRCIHLAVATARWLPSHAQDKEGGQGGLAVGHMAPSRTGRRASRARSCTSSPPARKAAAAVPLVRPRHATADTPSSERRAARKVDLALQFHQENSKKKK